MYVKTFLFYILQTKYAVYKMSNCRMTLSSKRYWWCLAVF